MAPEQLQGQAADARSDIWAAGAVLYELATGRRPFPQPSAPMLTDAILRQAPVPPRAVNANLSPELERILSKALEKDPEHRYQSAKELGADLRRLGISQVPMPVLAAASERSGLFKAGMVAALSVVLLLAVVFGALVLLRQRAAPGGGTPRIESLAVLPLENLSRDPEQEYFADGMTEELTTSLAQLSALRVVSRTSVMRYKGARKPLPEIARELNVDAVVEGSVMRSGDRVRITAQLIRGATDEHLWARSYDRDLRDVLTLQSEVAKDIAAEIQVELTSQEHTRLANSRSVNSDAYEAYLKGRYYWSKRTEEGLKRAIGFYELAIHKDASYAPAYGGLAESYASMGIFQQLPPAEAMPKAKAAAVRALEIDNQVAEAHMALASVLFWYDWDPQGAEREFKHALEVNQNYATAHQRYSAYLVLMGRPEESLAEMRRARELDPLSLTIGASLGSRFLATRQYDLAIQQFQKTLDLDPNFVPARARLVTVYEDKGMYPEALAERKKMASLGDESLNDVIAAEHAYHEFGARGYWRARLAQLSDRAKRQYVSPVDLASCYARLGEKEQVVQWLQKAQEERSAGLVNLNVSPEFDSVRSDPRYRDLMRRVGLPL
jgi:TolB-like protein/Tfp pilus assembly protein PilF